LAHSMEHVKTVPLKIRMRRHDRSILTVKTHTICRELLGFCYKIICNFLVTTNDIKIIGAFSFYLGIKERENSANEFI